MERKALLKNIILSALLVAISLYPKFYSEASIIDISASALQLAQPSTITEKVLDSKKVFLRPLASSTKQFEKTVQNIKSNEKIALLNRAAVSDALNNIVEKIFGPVIEKGADFLEPIYMPATSTIFVQSKNIKSSTASLVSSTSTSGFLNTQNQNTFNKNIFIKNTENTQGTSIFGTQGQVNTQGTEQLVSKLQQLTNRVSVLESKNNFLKNYTSTLPGTSQVAPVIQNIYNNTYVTSGSGYSYSVPSNNTDSISTLIREAILPLQNQIDTLSSATSSGSSGGSGTSTYSFSTSTTRSVFSAGANLVYDSLNGIFSFATTTARAMFSTTATGLSYDNGTGIFSLTSGYNIPLTASTTEWASAYASTTNLTTFWNVPSTRITAGTGLSWTGNTLSNTGVTSIGGLTGAVSTSSLGIIPFATTTTRALFSAGTGIGYDSSTGVISIATSSLSTGDLLEGSNLYFTNSRADARADLRIAAASTTIRGMLSSAATGLSYDNGTGIFSLTSGYNIPLTASTTEWASKISSQWTTSGSNIYYSTGSVGIGTTSPVSSLSITAGTGASPFTIASSTAGVNMFNITSRGVFNFGSSGANLYSIDTQARTFTLGNTITINSGTTPVSIHDSSAQGLLVSSQGNYVALGRTGIGEALRADVGTIGNYKVGIGTTTPLAKLDVYGSAGQYDSFAVSSSSKQRIFTVSYNGNVGVSTSSPGYALTVSGDINFTGALRSNGDAGTSGYVLQSTGSGVQWVATSSLGISSGAASQWTTSGSNIYYSTGSVGIGTTTPAATFAVNGSAYVSQNIITDGLLTINGSGTSTIKSNILLSGDIIPSADNTYKLGAPDRMWRDVYIGPGSLYVNGQKVLQTDVSNNVTVTADVNQNLVLKSSGTGDLEFNPSGTGQLLLKGNVRLTAGKTITTSDGSLVPFTNGVTSGNLSISGNSITATNLNGGISLTPIGTGGVYVTSGNFGVSTTTPGYALTVSGDINFTGALRTNGSAGTSGYILQSTGSGVQWVDPATLSIAFSTTTIRGMLSSTATGLSYDNGTGIFSLTSGYNIPLTASTTEWASKISSQWTTSGSNIYYSTGSVGIGTTTPGYALTVSGDINFTGALRSNGDAGTSGYVLQSTGSGVQWVATSSLGISSGAASQWTTSGSNIYYSTGKVGIGTSTPSATLSVTGVAGTTDLLVLASSTNTRVLTVTSAGNLGIGTTSPSATLAVVGSAYFTGTSTLTRIMGATTTLDLTLPTGVTSGYQLQFAGGSNGGVKLYNAGASGNSIDFRGNNNSILITGATLTGTTYSGAQYITTPWLGSTNSSGNDVSWVISKTGNGSNKTVYALTQMYATNSNTGPKLLIGANGIDFALRDNSSWNETYDSIAMSIASSTGYIGIGTTTPAFPLDVYNTVSSNQSYGYLNSSGAIGTSSGSNPYSIRAQGRILASEFNAVSDMRLKDVQFSLDSGIALSAIDKLKPVSFTWKNNPNGQPVIGLLAQEVEEVIPNAVSKIKTEKFEDQRELSYNQIVAVMIGAIQELKKQVNHVKTTFEKITNWFSDSGDRLNVQGMICVDDTCVTKEQFKMLLIRSGDASYYIPTSTTTSETTSSTSTGTTTLSTGDATGTTGTDNNGTSTPPTVPADSGVSAIGASTNNTESGNTASTTGDTTGSTDSSTVSTN